MDSDPESSECPLCLDTLEADDLTFFPCTCCYQICRFCWHRIRTDENGLCPACRKPYSENPAQFKALTDEELQQVKRDRKLKDSNKKPKINESRKHLANLRVVQRNLVFVNGLPSRLADTELLRRNDHFGKYGKIVKLVTSPAHNGQSNSICVYITYSRSEEALRAIQSLSNYQFDGRTLKATLGTTKYCSRYLKGASCQKADCLYLHEPGDPSASFTKEQMQQGLHLEYERALMEQYTNKTASKNGRTTTNDYQNESTQRRTELTSATNSSSTANEHSDTEVADETSNTNHHLSNGYTNDTFTSTTATNGDTLNGDSDLSSTSSQTSSEHDPSLRTQLTTSNATRANNWPDESVTFYPTTTQLTSSKDDRSNETTGNHTVKNFDQLPEYKLFSSNGPSIHSILFGNNDTNPTQQSQRPFINRTDHDLREIEKRLMGTDLNNPSYSQVQENDELGFDPCSLFMSALASDIEDERRPAPSKTSFVQRPTLNTYGLSSSQYPPTTNNSSAGQINPSWMMQQQYHHYQEPPTTPQKQQQQQQQRYPQPFNGPSPRQMWNGNQQYPTRLDFSNQMHPQQQQQQQRLPPATPQYSQTMNNTYSSNGTVTTNHLSSNDRWMNPSWTDPAIVSLGHKLDSMPSQWSNTTPSQGSSMVASGNNLTSNPRWPQQQQQTHTLPNGMYMPYSTASGIDDGSRS